MTEQTPSTFLQALRVLCAALMSAMVVLLVAITVMLAQNGDAGGTAPVWTYAVVVVVAAAEVTLINLVGYRFTPIAPGTEEAAARLSSVTQMQTLTILRFALAEMVALISIVLAFVVHDGGLFVVLLGVLLAEVIMYLSIWPSERMITRVTEALESEGGRSYLREALDSPAPSRKGTAQA